MTGGELRRPVRSFVLRQGRMSPAQHRAYDELLPRWGVAFASAPPDFDAVFGRRAPRVLEIGCGMGETTAAIAAARPDVDFIGVEVHAPGVGSLLKQVDALGLSNLRVIRHDAVEVVAQMIPEASLAGIHVFFPDPWPKKRHHKRRLLQPAFVAALAARLVPGGYLHAATDWEEYALRNARDLRRRAAAGQHRRGLRAASGLPPADQVRDARPEARPRRVRPRVPPALKRATPDRRRAPAPPRRTRPAAAQPRSRSSNRASARFATAREKWRSMFARPPAASLRHSASSS